MPTDVLQTIDCTRASFRARVGELEVSPAHGPCLPEIRRGQVAADIRGTLRNEHRRGVGHASQAMNRFVHQLATSSQVSKVVRSHERHVAVRSLNKQHGVLLLHEVSCGVAWLSCCG